ncbi:MAG TPA: SDR family oxidoreductase [Candidatus Acidoferrales bacterium]
MKTQDGRETVLITGGTDGFGRATAVLLAEQGYRVFAAGRSAERRAALEAYAQQGGLPIETVEMDVTDDTSVDRALDEVHMRAGPIDVLINNAGIGIYAVVEEIKMPDWRRQLETNFFGIIRVTQRVLPEMRARRRGRIVNMSSIAGKATLPLMGAYCASKHALEALSDALRLEVAGFGIHVVVIEPGYIPTSFQPISRELSTEYAARAATSPYARVYQGFKKARDRSTQNVKDTPQDCARVILRAIREKPPWPRYPVTRQARKVLFAKRFLSDRMLDGIILRRLGLAGREAGSSEKGLKSRE